MSALELLDAAIAKVDSLLAGAGSKPAPSAAPANGAQKKAAPAKPSTPAPASAPAPAPAPAAPAPAAAGAGASPELTAHFSKVLIKVARIVSVAEVENSEKLYKLQIDLGGETRQVCAGLRQFLGRDQLENALVTVVCNLKPAKLAGNLSEAMILAGEHELPGGALVVKTLQPPAGSELGDQVFLEGGAASAETVKQLKSDVWKAVAGELKVACGRKATLGGAPLVTAKGHVTLPAEIPDGASIH